jgi:hypothetical protein
LTIQFIFIDRIYNNQILSKIADEFSCSDTGFLIYSRPVQYVEKGDILALLAGTAIVIIVAVIANPPDFFGKAVFSGIADQTAGVKTQAPSPGLTIHPNLTPTSHETPDKGKSDLPPYRIFFTDKPFSYPVYKMPDHMEIFGASEILWRNQEWVPFAFIEDTRGGLTHVFSVPYPVWAINTTVISDHSPQYSNLRFVLCYADTGGIIEGEEILNPGTSYRIVQTSNTKMYFIIAAGSINRFRIDLETPRSYYDAHTPQ